ncbi:MAG: 4-hydroxythreonine-4-phosphate dehydrogenase PdxA [Opitutae bacterium]
MSQAPIALTCGDPAGVGPELIAAWIKSHPKLMDQVAPIGPLSWLKTLGIKNPESLAVGSSNYLINYGKPDAEGSRIAIAAMELAAKGVAEGKFRAVVTGPVSKNNLSRVGYKFPGQTEFFAHHWHGEPVMAFAGGKMTVGLVTWHTPLQSVSSQINSANIRQTILALIQLRKKLGDKNPRIAVCGLNPHAGENGLLGQEDKTIIQPVVELLRGEGFDVTGPLSGDTVFYRHLKGEFDAVVAMYHDQGLAPLKLVDFATSANLTLGLKHVRTSPDHGTAFEIAGKGMVDCGSFESAVRLAEILSSR